MSNNTEMITVRKGDNTQLAPNFTSHELFLGVLGYNGTPTQHYALGADSHELDARFPDVLQEIRDFVSDALGDIPIRITSTKRVVRTSATSQHLSGHAVDFQFTKKNSEALKLIFSDILEAGELFYILSGYNVRGIGMYNTFMHIDFRPNTGTYGHTIGSYNFALWFGQKYNLTAKNITFDYNAAAITDYDDQIEAHPSLHQESMQEAEDDKHHIPTNSGIPAFNAFAFGAMVFALAMHYFTKPKRKYRLSY